MRSLVSSVVRALKSRTVSKVVSVSAAEGLQQTFRPWNFVSVPMLIGRDRLSHNWHAGTEAVIESNMLLF